jgi:hypothetical protein
MAKVEDVSIDGLITMPGIKQNDSNIGNHNLKIYTNGCQELNYLTVLDYCY